MVALLLDVCDETDEAYLVSDGDIQTWIPKSQVEVLNEIGENCIEVEMPERLAKEKGFI